MLLTGRLRVRDWDNGDTQGHGVEIDAEAIGHDLLWGTTTFEKDSQRRGDGCARRPAAHGSRTSWAAPGVDATRSAPTEWTAPSRSSSAPGPEPRPLELAGVETPF